MLQAVRTRMNTGLRRPGVASRLQKRYLTRSNKDSIVFRLRLTRIRVQSPTHFTRSCKPTATIFRTLVPILPPYLRLPLLQQHARSGFSFYRGRDEAVHHDRLRRPIVECSCSRESIEAAWPCKYLPSINFLGRARGYWWWVSRYPCSHWTYAWFTKKKTLRFPLLCGFFHC